LLKNTAHFLLFSFPLFPLFPCPCACLIDNGKLRRKVNFMMQMRLNHVNKTHHINGIGSYGLKMEKFDMENFHLGEMDYNKK
jgi:hypothetical protein